MESRGWHILAESIKGDEHPNTTAKHLVLSLHHRWPRYGTRSSAGQTASRQMCNEKMGNVPYEVEVPWESTKATECGPVGRVSAETTNRLSFRSSWCQAQQNVSMVQRRANTWHCRQARKQYYWLVFISHLFPGIAQEGSHFRWWESIPGSQAIHGKANTLLERTSWSRFRFIWTILGRTSRLNVITYRLVLHEKIILKMYRIFKRSTYATHLCNQCQPFLKEKAFKGIHGLYIGFLNTTYSVIIRGKYFTKKFYL